MSASLETAPSWDALPENARRFLERIAEICDVPLAWVSVGQSREATLEVHPPDTKFEVSVGR